MILTLNENRSVSSLNEIQNLNIDIEREEKLLPVNEIQGNIDAYIQYNKEKDACDNYRLIFTIRPYCSNILFNHITEAVFQEGNPYCDLATMEIDAYDENKHLNLGYVPYKLLDINLNEVDIHNTLSGSPITRDTGYSSDTFKKSHNFLNYNCGIDIFNNHLLRKKEFICVNSRNNQNNVTTFEKMRFNTLFDYIREPWGNVIVGLTNTNTNGNNVPYKNTAKLHIYNLDNVYSFTDAISNNLHEENGWIGFYNTTTLNVLNNSLQNNENVTSDEGYNICKLINNAEPNAFIDMYPTRKHYSFVPHDNQYYKRIEKNWDYCLTYPYKNEYLPIVYDNDFNINGIICELDLEDNITINQLLHKDPLTLINQPMYIMFKTHTKHTLQAGDRVNIYVYNELNRNTTKKHHTCNNIVVSSVGKNGYDSQYYFTVKLNDVISEIELEYQSVEPDTNIKFRFAKISGSNVCKYYLRKFKKLPNFEHTKINTNYPISESDIFNTLLQHDYSTSLNRLGFSKTIYGDDIVQIIFDDDIKLNGLKDNLGRDLSTIYLTIIKTNNGYKEWYDDNIYNLKNIEYSHCFGKVTSGFDLPSYVTDEIECNVRRQHNLNEAITLNLYNTNDFGETTLKESSLFLDSNIHITGGNTSNNQGTFIDGQTGLDGALDAFTFFGDLVEFDETLLEETTLEDVQHRFNTAQRETLNEKFGKLIVDNITSDDYMCYGFKTETMPNILCNETDRANLAPEGYFYQAHYPIKLKEYDTIVNTGYHIKIEFEVVTSINGGETQIIRTGQNYYLEVGNEIYLLKNDGSNEKYIARVGKIMGDDFTIIQLELPHMEDTDLTNYIMFKPNPIKPDNAYDFNDVSGRYIWRDIIPPSKLDRTSELYDSIFMNNAIYFYKDINFYLKRQDPFGEFGLLPTTSVTCEGRVSYSDLEFTGNYTEVESNDYFQPGENNIC